MHSTLWTHLQALQINLPSMSVFTYSEGYCEKVSFVVYHLENSLLCIMTTQHSGHYKVPFSYVRQNNGITDKSKLVVQFRLNGKCVKV